jgi:arylsulfatase A-like enzyme
LTRTNIANVDRGGYSSCLVFGVDQPFGLALLQSQHPVHPPSFQVAMNICSLLFPLVLLAVTSLSSHAAAPQKSTPPNVVVIFIDDMGYADINPFGDNAYQTPNLNRMAKEGRVFRDFVVSSAVCSASRSALLTGCYHTRIGIRGALGPKSDIGINADEMTLAELCRSKGYATAAFGKWHLGHHPKFLPTNHGFDEYYGIPYSNDMWPLHPASVAKRAKDPNAEIPWAALPMIRATQEGGVKIVNEDMQPEDQEQMTKEFTERAVGFIKDHADQPFFLYLPHPMVHVPLYASEAFRGKSGAGIFGDVVMEVDWSVGQILGAIEDIGVERNTLVIFTSDNGPWLSYGSHAGQATPLREGKGTMFEGGYREPTIMWWKGKIPAGTECDQLCSTIDIVPTVAKLIGADLPDHKIDGKDIRPLMFGQENAQSPHDAFYCYYGGGQLQAVRNDRFKLVFPHSYRTLNGHPGGTGGLPIPYQQRLAKFALYDLDQDISEKKNVMKDYPKVVEALSAAAERAREDLGDKLEKRSGRGSRPAGKMQPGDERLPLLWR